MTTLDVDRLPREAWIGPEGNRLNLADIVQQQRTMLDGLMEQGRLRLTPNFGFAAAKPVLTEGEPVTHWDDPYAFTWFVTGWGFEAKRFIANAVRKLRATLRHQMSSLDIVDLEATSTRAWVFANRVASQDPDGSFAWGDFPYGGAVLTDTGSKYQLACSCSGFAQAEDHAVSQLLGSLMTLEIRRRHSSNDPFN